MKHNTILILSVLVVSAVLFSGCMNTKELSEEEQSMIAEYSAGILLRYSDQYEYRLITAEQAAKENAGEGEQAQSTAVPEATATPEPAAPSPATESGVSADGQQAEAPNVSLNDLYHVEGLDFTYDSYRFCSQYPEKASNGFSPMSAGENETLLVIMFHVKNNSGSSRKVDLSKRNIQYTLDIDGNQFSQPEIGMLDNMGMNYLTATIGKGKTEKAALVFKMGKERRDASGISLMIKDGNNTAGVQLK